MDNNVLCIIRVIAKVIFIKNESLIQSRVMDFAKKSSPFAIGLLYLRQC